MLGFAVNTDNNWKLLKLGLYFLREVYYAYVMGKAESDGSFFKTHEYFIFLLLFFQLTVFFGFFIESCD